MFEVNFSGTNTPRMNFPVTQGDRAKRYWANRYWAKRDWAKWDWAKRDWAKWDWAKRDWAKRDWAKWDWAKRDWAKWDWAKRDWAKREDTEFSTVHFPLRILRLRIICSELSIIGLYSFIVHLLTCRSSVLH